MRVAIIQSNYIPWKGYFDIINDVDLFIFLDDVQFTKNDWRNRNLIKTSQGLKWLSIPVGTNINRKINEVTIKNEHWQMIHYKTLQQYYKKAPYYSIYKKLLEEIYIETKWSSLSSLNQFVIMKISEILGINTSFINSSDLNVSGRRLEKVINLLKKVNADVYVSGPAAKAYIDENVFQENKIELIYKDYQGYPEYPQLYPPFEHKVTILDLLFNTGPDAPYYIWGWRQK